MEHVLEIKNMNVSFRVGERVNHVLKSLSLNLKKGEILSIVGASGSGKTVLTHALMGVLQEEAIYSGEIYLDGALLKDHGKVIEKVAMIPQTVTYLDPLMKVGKQLNLSDSELSALAKHKYPFQCSGGMIRNALFSLAYEKDASIILADEPTPGLDIQSAREVLAQLSQLAQQGKAVILITHDIDLAMQISERVAVFYDGTIVEIASREDCERGKLRHAYTRALFQALPQNEFQAVNLPLKFDENKCFCAGICEKYNENCNRKLEYQWYENGMVRCNNVSYL